MSPIRTGAKQRNESPRWPASPVEGSGAASSACRKSPKPRQKVQIGGAMRSPKRPLAGEDAIQVERIALGRQVREADDVGLGHGAPVALAAGTEFDQVVGVERAARSGGSAAARSGAPSSAVAPLRRRVRTLTAPRQVRSPRWFSTSNSVSRPRSGERPSTAARCRLPVAQREAIADAHRTLEADRVAGDPGIGIAEGEPLGGRPGERAERPRRGEQSRRDRGRAPGLGGRETVVEMHARVVAGRAAEEDEIRRRDRAMTDLGRERVGGGFERRTRLHG